MVVTKEHHLAMRRASAKNIHARPGREKDYWPEEVREFLSVFSFNVGIEDGKLVIDNEMVMRDLVKDNADAIRKSNNPKDKSVRLLVIGNGSYLQIMNPQQYSEYLQKIKG